MSPDELNIFVFGFFLFFLEILAIFCITCVIMYCFHRMLQSEHHDDDPRLVFRTDFDYNF